VSLLNVLVFASFVSVVKQKLVTHVGFARLEGLPGCNFVERLLVLSVLLFLQNRLEDDRQVLVVLLDLVGQFDGLFLLYFVANKLIPKLLRDILVRVDINIIEFVLYLSHDRSPSMVDLIHVLPFGVLVALLENVLQRSVDRE
jgi:hypothetical protein